MFTKRILLSLSFILSLLCIKAQTSAVRGFVYDKETSEPAIFTNVLLKELSIGATTDVNGYFSITKLVAGTYTLVIESPSFKRYEQKVTVNKGQIFNTKIFLEEDGSTELDEVQISGQAQEAKTNVGMSVTKITSDDIKSIPSIGGESDIATYFQTVPGVVTTGDQGGQMYVRGGSPIQNKVLLDGMVIYNPFHSIGFFSVFDTEIIRNADIYTGGFNAQYGGRISSIMDITTRNGNAKKFGGKIAASPFTAKILLEGPLKKAEKPGDGNITYVLSAKQSYLAESSKLFYKYIDSAGLPFNYRDLYGKVSFSGKNGSKFNLFGFNFKDKVNYQLVSDLSWNSYGVGSNFLMVPGSSPVLIGGKFSFSEYRIGLKEANLNERSSKINGFNLGFDFKYFIGENELKYGIEVLGFGTDFTTFNSVGRELNQKENTTELGSYFSYKIVANRVVVEPSLRIHYYATLKQLSPEPRIGLKFNATEKFRFKAAAGVYSQNLISANSDRDVVNLFYGFLSGPDNLPKTLTLENGEVRERTHSLQKANHLIAGFEYDINKKWSLNVEGYHKWFTQVTNVNRNKLFPDDPSIIAEDIFKKDFIIETGKAYGADFVLKFNEKQLYLWGVYSYGKVDRWDGLRTYSPVFDRRHSINLIGAYKFGAKKSWEVNARWNFGSGLPFTQTAGYYHRLDFAEGTGTDVTSSNTNELTTIYAGLNEGRLPSYHRLDINLKKRIEFKKNTVLELNAGMTNAYNRDNVFYVDRVSSAVVNQLPLLPSVGLNLTF